MNELKEFKFFTEQELLNFSNDLNLAKKRSKLMLKISKYTRIISAIVHKVGFDSEKGLENSMKNGYEFEFDDDYDSYLLAQHKREVAKMKLSEMPKIDKIVDTVQIFFYEVQRADPDFWKKMKAIASIKAAKINQEYNNLFCGDGE